jgi:very-short-patch-repair endonuclease
MKKQTINDLICKFNNIHNNIYDYNLIKYIDSKTKIKIICSIHGIFEQTPSDHMSGHGCPKCSIDKNTNHKRNDLTHLLNKANSIHNNKYDYTLIKNHINMHQKQNIICKKHGIFNISLHSHINKKRGCKLCAIENRMDSIKTFIEKANIIHNNKYNYDLVDYINSKTKVKIICPKHGEFFQAPNYHLLGSGCPKCNSSKGEIIIMKYLTDNKIKFEYQKSFDNCKYKYKLKFDFYLLDYNCCVEYDGEQHYKSNKYFGGEIGYKNRILRDNIKTDYCKNNNIILLRFNKNNIKNLSEIINTTINNI